MTEPTTQVAETIQTASVKHNPSAAHDVNPPTAATKQVPESAISDTDSIPSDVVDPSRMVRTVVRRRNLPPLPDLRFEQSYLASLKDADTWGRIAWITVRDQVLSIHFFRTPGDTWQQRSRSDKYLDDPAAGPRHTLDSRALRMAVLEPQCIAQRPNTR